MTDVTNRDNIINQFYEYLDGVLAVYHDVVPILREELDYIISDDVVALDKTLTKQQALLLKTKNFEQRIEDYLSKLDITANNLSETIPQLPEEEHLRFYTFLGNFDRVLSEVQFYKEKCRELLQSKLYQIDRVLISNDAKHDSTTYDNKAEGVSRSLYSKTFEKKI